MGIGLLLRFLSFFAAIPDFCNYRGNPIFLSLIFLSSFPAPMQLCREVFPAAFGSIAGGIGGRGNQSAGGTLPGVNDIGGGCEAKSQGHMAAKAQRLPDKQKPFPERPALYHSALDHNQVLEAT
jgi:hypothetical protein